jgi:hypothetical protein
MTRNELFTRLAAHLLDKAALSRVHPDTTEPEARAVLAVLAGLPSSEQVWASAVQIVAIVSGERLTGVELARRAQLFAQRAKTLSERARGKVYVLQLAVYERAVPDEERAFILDQARSAPLFGKSRVATWIYSLSESKLYSSKLRGLPQELSPEDLAALLLPSR